MLPYYFKTAVDLMDSIIDTPKVIDGRTVYVISDSAYKKYQQTEALKEIAILEQRALSYEQTAESIRKTISELKAEAGLLPEPINNSAGDTDKPGLTD